jgi:hypothetical protein
MATYTLCHAEDTVVQDWDGFRISPVYPENWASYQAWLAEGNTPNPAPPLPYSGPQQIALWQLRSVLRDRGEFETVNDDIMSGTNQKLKDFWEYGNYIGRNDPITAQLQTVLGYTDEQMDQLFIDGGNEQP